MEPKKSPPFILREGDPPTVLGQLPEELESLLDGATRVVKITYQTYNHIVSRRASEAEWHVELVLGRLVDVISDPTHIGKLTGSSNRVEVYKLVDGDPCGVCVSLKCLDGETWVNTGFPLGERSLQKHLSTGKLRPVEQQQGSLFNND